MSAEHAFSRDAPVLWFRPRPHANPGPRNQRLWLVWPAWAWRVAIPSRPTHGLNLFQRTVLALARAGIHSTETLGTRMGVHPDLAHLVALELLHMGLLGQDGRPTAGGVRKLEEAEHQAPPTAAWVFQDPFSGELWPRAEERLYYAEREISAEGRTSLLFGDSDRKWKQRVLTVKPEKVAYPLAPEPGSVIQAARSHRRARRRLAREEDLELFSADDGDSWESEAVSTSGVSFVEDRPQPVWLSAFCYFPRGSDGDNHWYATDPFGLGASQRLRAAIERRRGVFPPLRNALARFLGARVQEDDGVARELAELEVERRYGVGFRSHLAFDALVDVHATILGADRLTTMAGRGAYGALRRALEEVFLELGRGAPWRDITARDREFNRKHLNHCAAEVGLEPLPWPVLKVHRGQVRAAAQGGGGLRPRLAAAVMRAAREEEHPLRSAASTMPGVIAEVDRLADAAGHAVHDARYSLNAAALDGDIEALHMILKSLGLGPPAQDETGEA